MKATGPDPVVPKVGELLQLHEYPESHDMANLHEVLLAPLFQPVMSRRLL